MSFNDLSSFFYKILNFKLFVLNQTPITPSSIIMFIIIMILFVFSSRSFNRFFVKRILDKFQIDEGIRYPMLRVIHYLIILIGAVVAFQFVGIDLSGLAVIFGLLSVGIGFGLQNVTSNFVAGLILLFERPIRVGDRVTVGDTEGEVTDINIRSTKILTLNNISIIVPNSEFVSRNVINWSIGDPKIRLEIEVGVSYNSDLDKVLTVLKHVGLDHPETLKDPQPKILFTGFGDSAWNMRLCVWIQNPKRHHDIRSEINCEIVRKFRENQIEIPFPQRDVHIKNQLSRSNT